MTATLDLTALDRTAPVPVPDPIAKERTVTAEVLGRPLQIPVKDIDEDPGQPRQEFSAESMEELENSIRLHGVKTPISIRPHPTEQKRWISEFRGATTQSFESCRESHDSSIRRSIAYRLPASHREFAAGRSEAA